MPEYNKRSDIPAQARLTGSAREDFAAAVQYIEQLYRVLVLESGVFQQPTGFALVSETAFTFSHTFAQAQPDVNYSVTVSATGYIGTPTVNAFVVKGVTKSVNGFAVELFAAPGGGNSVSLDWQVQR